MRRLITVITALLLLDVTILPSSYADGGYGVIFVLGAYEQLVQQQEICNESEPSTAYERSAAFKRLSAKVPEFVSLHQAVFPVLRAANNWTSPQEMRRSMAGKVNCRDVPKNVDQFADALSHDWPETRMELQKIQQSISKRQGSR